MEFAGRQVGTFRVRKVVTNNFKVTGTVKRLLSDLAELQAELLMRRRCRATLDPAEPNPRRSYIDCFGVPSGA